MMADCRLFHVFIVLYGICSSPEEGGDEDVYNIDISYHDFLQEIDLLRSISVLE